jgi:hypothetical protein
MPQLLLFFIHQTCKLNPSSYKPFFWESSSLSLIGKMIRTLDDQTCGFFFAQFLCQTLLPVFFHFQGHRVVLD